MKRFLTYCLCLVVVLALCSGCADKGQPRLDLQGRQLAVAPFSQPHYPWELLAGSLPEHAQIMTPEVFSTLDGLLSQALDFRKIKNVRGLAQVNQCREIVLMENQNIRLSALQYWIKVGRCLPADYLLVPQIFVWRERKGGEWGVEEPAKVVFDLYLLDVEKGRLLKRFHFEDEQQSLSANILDIKTFFKRKGRWISVSKLAQEGLIQGLEELGL